MVKLLLSLLILVGSFAYAGTNQTVMYQGRVTRPDGTTINTGSLTFTLSIYSSDTNHCLLYSENQTVNMNDSQGLFNVPLGAGTRTDGGTHSFNQVFINGSTLSNLNCTSGTTYTAAATDDRSLVVSFNDNGTAVAFDPINIKSTPFAMQAHEIDGWGLSNLVKVSSVGSPTTFTTAEMANAKKLAAPGPCTAGQILKYDGFVWACAADATGSASDASYATKGLVQFNTDAATSGITVASGVATVNFGTGAHQLVKLDGSSKLPAVDGSALTNLNSGALSAAVPIAKGGTGATTAIAGFNALSPATSKGDLIVHDGTNNVRVGVGSNNQVLTADSTAPGGVKWAAAVAPASGITSLNGSSASSQSFAINPGGTAPSWTTDGTTGVHTLNLPSASTASVTAGLISKTDFDSFAAKLGTTTSFSGDVSGTYNSTKVDGIRGKNVAIGGYASGQTLRYDGSQWVNTKLDFADVNSKPTTLAGYGITDAATNTLADGKIFVGNGSNVATAVTMGGDATLSNTGALALNTVSVGKGGTGATSLTSNGVLLGNGTLAVSATAAGTADQVLRIPGAGGAPAFGALDLSKSAAVTGVLAMSNGGTGLNATGFGISKVVTTNGSGALQGSSCAQYQVLSFDATGAVYCANVNALSGGFVNGGNLFGADAVLGTNDNSKLSFETAGNTRMTIDTIGNVGFGSGAPPDSIYIYRDTDVDSSLSVAVSGTSANQNANLQLITQSDGTNTLESSATTRGWSLTAPGAANPIVSRRNDFYLSYWDGTSWTDALVIDSVTRNVGIGTVTPGAGLDIATTGTSGSAVIVPRDTTANRPSSPVNGMIRYNTSTSKLEAYQGGAWVDMVSVSGSYLSTSGGTLSGGLTVSSGGIINNGGLNNNSGGITNAGTVTGVTSVTGTGALTVASGGTNTNLTLSSNGTGSVNMTTGNGTGLSVLNGPASTVNYVSVKGAAAAGSPVIGTAGSDTNIDLTFASKGTGNTIFSTGNVGIGTSAPGFRLSLDATAAQTMGMGRHPTSGAAGNNLIVTSGSAATSSTDRNGGNLILSSGTATGSGSSQLQFQTATAGASGAGDRAPTTKMLIDGDGKVGIGTTSPWALLDVQSSDASSFIRLRNTNSITAAQYPTISAQNFMGTANGGFPLLQLFNSRGNASTPTAIKNMDYLGILSFAGASDASSGTLSGAQIIAVAAQDFASNSAGTDLTFLTSTIATSTPSEKVRIKDNGYVGVGTPNPRAALDVNGVILGKAVSATTTTIDFGSSNLAYTSQNCGLFTLNNLKDGGTYTLAVNGTTSSICSFSAAGFTVKMPPDHNYTLEGTSTLYTFLVMGGNVFVSWVPGY